jgi:hypothetical protein
LAPLRQRLLDAGQLGPAPGVGRLPGLPGAQRGLLEQRAIVQGLQRLGEDGVLQRVGGDAFLVTAGGAVTLAGKAGVVAVAAALAEGCRSDEPVAAAPATQQAGQQVVGGIGRLQPGGVTTLLEQLAGLEEHLHRHQRLVPGRVGLPVERQQARVGRVAQHVEHTVGRPAAPAARAVTLVVEQPTDHGRPLAPVHVQGEDPPHDGDLLGYRNQ